MDKKNTSSQSVIYLIGFQFPHVITFLVFFLFLLSYCVTICGNLLIITMVFYSKSLHSPMYFFLSQLAVADILLVTDILPNTLDAILEESITVISVSSCITQFYFFAIAETSECLLLTVMSYDRYLAICKPLHYPMLMSHKFCWITIITTWILTCLAVLSYTLPISRFDFCGPNIMDNFFCDLDPILELSCSDTTIVQIERTICATLFAVIPFFLIIVSYVYIIITIFQIPSITGRKKVFSTCSAHLIVVSMFYGTLVSVYLVPRGKQLWNITKFLSLLYTVLTPMLNPIIYSLRNADLKQVIKKVVPNVFIIKISK
uniref:Olfactory receptor n=1 Tax=Pyxicephalus adspersus TaxID=30357 RepID=A0AAV3AKK1_PYXAD|nr:TPA: hypothetical protein GDO54_005816 [Pyxicephalus adspersus]